jgi:hypothetical protein
MLPASRRRLETVLGSPMRLKPRGEVRAGLLLDAAGLRKLNGRVGEA